MAGCYIGYDTPRSMGDASGGGMCAPVFQEFMEPATERFGGGPFEVPEGCSFIKIDRFSGARLPDDVRVYCGHEYTLANARFAAHVDPDNKAVAERLVTVAAMRERGEVTLPTTIGEERATNPFMRATDAADLARLRTLKDSFG